MTGENGEAYENTDKEIWREIKDNYYTPSIFVTKENNIGINVDGFVVVMSARDWLKLVENKIDRTLKES